MKSGRLDHISHLVGWHCPEKADRCGSLPILCLVRQRLSALRSFAQSALGGANHPGNDEAPEPHTADARGSYPFTETGLALNSGHICGLFSLWSISDIELHLLVFG